MLVVGLQTEGQEHGQQVGFALFHVAWVLYTGVFAWEQDQTSYNWIKALKLG